MDAKATYNNLRLKAYYWEKQLRKGRTDEQAVAKFNNYTEQMEAAKAVVEAEKEEVRAKRQAALEERVELWRKNIRRNAGKHKAYDTITQKQIDKRIESWQPEEVVRFD